VERVAYLPNAVASQITKQVAIYSIVLLTILWRARNL